MEPPHSGSDRIAELLGQEPELDEVTRARMEKNLLAAVAAGRHLEIADTPFAVETAEHEYEEEEVSSVRRPWGAIGIGTIAAAAAAAALVWAAGIDEANGPGDRVTATFLRHEAGETVDRGDIEAGTELETDDGERIEVRVADARVDVTPGSTVRFDRVDGDRVEVYLSRGSVDIELHPLRTGDQTLRVTTDIAHIDVVGTVFSVAVDAKGDTRVSTVEGTVRVTARAGGVPRLVEAGEQVTVAADQAGTRATDEAVELGGSGQDPASLGAAATVPAANDTVPPGELQEHQGYPEGDESLAPAEGSEAADAPPSISDRLGQAEAALDRGDHRGARRILQAVASSASRADHRVRAHTLIAESFTAQRDFPSAVAAYRRAADAGGRSMGAQNALFAMGRLFERQMHDSDAAKAAYQDYLVLAPAGAHAGRVERALCRLGEAGHCSP